MIEKNISSNDLNDDLLDGVAGGDESYGPNTTSLYSYTPHIAPDYLANVRYRPWRPLAG